MDFCHAQVYKGRRKYTGQITAMKFIMKHGKSETDLKSLRQEIEILRTLRHENIIRMLDDFETPTDFCVVTEFAQGPSHFQPTLCSSHPLSNMQSACRGQSFMSYGKVTDLGKVVLVSRHCRRGTAASSNPFPCRKLPHDSPCRCSHPCTTHKTGI